MAIPELPLDGGTSDMPDRPASGVYPHIRCEGEHTIVIIARDGHEFRVDADITVPPPFWVLLDGHQMEPNVARLLAAALRSMAAALS